MAEREMARHLRPKSKPQRVQLALKKVEEQGWTGAEAARWAGVTPETVARHRARRRREKLAAMGVEGPVPARPPKAELRVDPLGVNEKRQVEPISEFVRKYFANQRCFSCRDAEGRGMRHEVPGFHDEMMRLVTESSHNRILINVPPEHSKTTNVTVFTAIHEICRNPNTQIAFISAGDDLANDMVRQVMNLLSDDDLYMGGANLIEQYGPFHDGSTTWTQKQMVVCGRQSMERDPTLRSFGIMSKIYGRRLNRAYLDDVADEDNNDTPQKVTKMFNKITSTIDSRVGDAGKMVVCGTRVNPADVYRSLGELPDYHLYRRPMILDYTAGLTLWPDHIGIEKALARRGRTTPERFELIYQNSDTMGLGATWTREHLDASHDLARRLGQLPPHPVTCFIGLDPAGDGPQSGYSAIALVAVDRQTGMRYLIDLVNVRAMKSSQMKSQVLDWCGRYPVRIFAYEGGTLQRQIFKYDQDFRSKLTSSGTKMVDRVTSGGAGPGGKRDPMWGIEAMSTPFHNGFWSLPWGDSEAKRRVSELEEQLLRFPMEGAPTDLMMALWIAETEILSFLGRGRRQMYSDRQREDELPDDILARRRVHSRGGEVRQVTPGDLKRRTMVNVSEQTAQEIYGAM